MFSGQMIIAKVLLRNGLSEDIQGILLTREGSLSSDDKRNP